MDVEQSNRGPAAFRASCIAGVKALTATIAILVSAIICFGDPTARLASATCLGAFAICKLVRIVNLDHSRRPPDDP
jgi:hypothetical protein